MQDPDTTQLLFVGRRCVLQSRCGDFQDAVGRRNGKGSGNNFRNSSKCRRNCFKRNNLRSDRLRKSCFRRSNLRSDRLRKNCFRRSNLRSDRLRKSASGATAPGFLVQFLNDFEHRNPFRRGERNDLALKLGRVSRSKGFSKKELEEVINLFIRRYAATDFTAEDIRQRITAGYQFIDSLPQKRKFPARVQIGFISLMTPPSRPMRAPKKKICWKKQRTSCPVPLHSRQRIQRSAPIPERLCAIRFRPARTRHHAAWQP